MQSKSNLYDSISFPVYDGSYDPSVWIKNVNSYFSFHHTPIGHRVETASFHLQGRALDWFWTLLASRSAVSWSDFVEELHSYFGSATLATIDHMGFKSSSPPAAATIKTVDFFGAGAQSRHDPQTSIDAAFAPLFKWISAMEARTQQRANSVLATSVLGTTSESLFGGHALETASFKNANSTVGRGVKNICNEDQATAEQIVGCSLLRQPPATEDLNLEEFVGNLVDTTRPSETTEMISAKGVVDVPVALILDTESCIKKDGEAGLKKMSFIQSSDVLNDKISKIDSANELTLVVPRSHFGNSCFEGTDVTRMKAMEMEFIQVHATCEDKMAKTTSKNELLMSVCKMFDEMSDGNIISFPFIEIVLHLLLVVSIIWTGQDKVKDMNVCRPPPKPPPIIRLGLLLVSI